MLADQARFVTRARREAARYGSDPLVFLRELVQNARDASATRIQIEIREDADGCRVCCRDDGSGMTEAHAREFLFRLYASSKGHGGEAGRFGVGFWSVLRFEPGRLTVRSRQAGQVAWGFTFDGDLARVEAAPPPAVFAAGTEITLERDRPWPGLAAAARDALRAQVRDVRRRDRPRDRLSIRVAGEEVNAPLALPAPSAAFEARGERGVVGLAAEPRVEVFSLGLRVRDAQTLDELVGGPIARAWCAVPGLAPAMVLESARVAPLLSRADLRADAALRGLERRARAALRRLMEVELERLHPPSLRERLSALLQAWPGVTAFAATLAIGLGVVAALARPRLEPSMPPEFAIAGEAAPALAKPRPLPPATSGTGEAPLWPALGDPRTPGLGVVHGDEPAVALRYAPAEQAGLLALRRATARDLLGPLHPERARSATTAADSSRAALWRVRVRVSAEGEPVPLPAASGTTPVRVRPIPVRWLERAGQPPLATFEPGFSDWVEYDLVATDDAPPRRRAPPALPPRLEEAAAAIGALPVAERSQAALAFVRGALHEARDVAAMERFAAAAGDDFASRALAAGVGDCDVLNGVLVLLLDAAGLPARLAVGVVARDGRAAPGLHAWAEVHDGQRWIALDATRPVTAPVAAVAAPVVARLEALQAEPRVPAWLGLAALAGAVVVAAGLLWRGRSTAVRTGATSIDALVRGALRHPEAFASAPAVFDRPLLARAGRGHVSLGEAWREAAAGRLYRAATPTRPLVREARARHGVVLDDRSPESATVADALGALDLEAFEERWSAGAGHPALNRLVAACADQGLRFEARLGPGSRVEALPLAARGPRPRLLLGEDCLLWRATAEQAAARATFELGQEALRALAVPEGQAVRVARALARHALAEAVR